MSAETKKSIRGYEKDIERITGKISSLQEDLIILARLYVKADTVKGVKGYKKDIAHTKDRIAKLEHKIKVARWNLYGPE